MCDATTLISSKQTDLHSCWIIYTKSDGKERLTVTDAKPMMPQGINNNDYDDDENQDSESSDNDGPDQSLHEILDAELQPEQPIVDNPQSQEIYEEHRRLAKEYLRVDTKLYYAQDLKEKLLAQMDPVERQEKQELLKKISEKEELLDLYNNLKQQLESIRSSTQQPTSAATCSAQTQQLSHSASGNIDDGCMQNEAVITAADVEEDWVVVGQSAPKS